MMHVYDSLSKREQEVIERALDELKFEAAYLGVTLLNTDPAARAAEALAVYFRESKNASQSRDL